MPPSRSGPPELDLARIRRYVRDRLPESLAAEVRLEVEVKGADVTIVERRPPWDPESGPEWSRLPIAQLRYDAARSEWTLYWQRASGRWQRYEAPSNTVDRLLKSLDADRHGAFWG